MPNSGFEQWTNLQPDGWITNSCPFCDPPWESYIVRQDSDAYRGNYNADLYGNGVFSAVAHTTFAVSRRPVKMRFHTKVHFAPCVNDTGYFEHDTIMAKAALLYNGTVVDSGTWSYSGKSLSHYQAIDVPLTQSAAMFDSCRIFFKGGKIYGGCGGVAEASRFKIDEVSLLYGCQATLHYIKQIDTVRFSGSSNHVTITHRHWDFGDGQTDTSAHPRHVYAHDGWYNACFTATGFDSSSAVCTATSCDSIYITHECIDSSLICPPEPPPLCCDAPLYEPVCGCDGVTYDNACIAMLWHGVSRHTPGPCLAPVKEIATTATVTLIPNPAKEKTELLIELPAEGSVTVKMKNIFGETMSESVGPHSSRYPQIFNLQKMASGLYFVQIFIDGNMIAVKKLMKD